LHSNFTKIAAKRIFKKVLMVTGQGVCVNMVRGKRVQEFGVTCEHVNVRTC